MGRENIPRSETWMIAVKTEIFREAGKPASRKAGFGVSPKPTV